MLSADDGRQVPGNGGQVPVDTDGRAAAVRGHQAGGERGRAAGAHMQGVPGRAGDGDGPQGAPEDHGGRPEARRRDGRLLYALRPANVAQNPHAPHGHQRVLQDRQPQHGRVVRQTAAGAGPSRRRGATGAQNAAGLRPEPGQQAAGGLRPTQPVLDLRLLVRAHLQGQGGGEMSVLFGVVPARAQGKGVQHMSDIVHRPRVHGTQDHRGALPVNNVKCFCFEIR